jgi:hypothetical protein
MSVFDDYQRLRALQRDTIIVLGQFADMLETQIAALDARVTALE